MADSSSNDRPKAAGQNGAAPAARADVLQPDKVVTVLAISPFDEDHVILSNILSHSNWRLIIARSFHDARAWLKDYAIPVVICESALPDATWRDVLTQLSHRPDKPALIVTDRGADEHLWAEVLNLGGYDLLMKPFDAMEVFRVVSLAWLNWKNTRDRKEARVIPAPLFAAAAF